MEENEVKKKQGKSKQQMLGTDIHQALQKRGYQIGYTTVNRYIRQVKQRSKEVYIRQHYSPGQAIEFDWAEVKLEIQGMTKRVMLAVFTSCYSNHRWGRLYYRQDMSSFLHAHACYFSFAGVIAALVIYDNMRVAVKKFTLRNKDKQPTEALLKLSTYYQFDYRFCNASRGNEKGHVERSVEYVRRKAFAPQDSFDSLEQANSYLSDICKDLNLGSAKGKSQSIDQDFKQEVQHMKVAPSPYDTAELRSLRVDKYSCIKVDTNYYSVPEGFVGQFINVKVYPDVINIYDFTHRLMASHERRHTRFEYYVKLGHYLKTLHTKPGALAGSTGLHQADQALKNIFTNHFADRAKDFVELLILTQQHQHSVEQLQEVIQECVQLCPHHPLCVDKLKFLLARSKQVQVQDTPPPSTQEMSQHIAQHCTQQLQDIQSLIGSNQLIIN